MSCRDSIEYISFFLSHQNLLLFFFSVGTALPGCGCIIAFAIIDLLAFLWLRIYCAKYFYRANVLKVFFINLFCTLFMWFCLLQVDMGFLIAILTHMVPVYSALPSIKSSTTAGFININERKTKNIYHSGITIVMTACAKQVHAQKQSILKSNIRCSQFDDQRME